VRGGNAEDYLDLKKKAGFCVEESGYPGFVDLWGMFHDEQSRTNLIDENGLK
jgi:hypothetical protein